MKHPASQFSFDELFAGLENARQRGFVSRRDQDSTGVAIYCYTRNCIYERAWDDFSLLARGLILDPPNRRVVAIPFPKFFNVGEHNEGFPDLPFDVYEKVDGSLIIIYHHANRWTAATKGSFDSEQAQWAQARLDAADLSPLSPGTTYLAEAIYPENRIVVHYSETGLVMLGAYDQTGEELSFDRILDVSTRLGWRAAARHHFSSISDLIAHARSLPAAQEGFVVRFADGLRLKVKGDEYKRIHALVSRCTPLAMWEAMLAGEDMVAIRRDLPEEFWADFDSIIAALTGRIDRLTSRIAQAADRVKHLSDKELGLTLSTIPAEVQRFIFAWRKGGGVLDRRTREAVFRTIRPSGNELDGYVPSYAMGRVMDEAG